MNGRLRQSDGEGSPQQQEQRRLNRRIGALEQESQRLIDAYQSGALELTELKSRRERIGNEQLRVRQRGKELQQLQAERQKREVIKVSVEEFCQTMSNALDSPSFETKQKILRLVVDRIEFREDQITIKHLVPVGNVRLYRNQYDNETPICPAHQDLGSEWLFPLTGLISQSKLAPSAVSRVPRILGNASS